MPENSLNELTAGFLRDFCRTWPTTAAWLGFHEYDGLVPDLSRESLLGRAADLRRFLAALEQFDPAGLDDAAWLDRQLVYHQAAFELFMLDEWRRWERDPLFYLEPLDVSGYVLRSYAPLETRARALLAHLAASGAVIDAMQANLTQAARPVVEVAARVTQGAAAFLQDDLPQAMADLQDESLRAAIAQAGREAAERLLQTAAWLKDDLAPRADGDYALGGPTFSRLLYQGEAADIPLERLWEVAEADLARNKAEFLETAAQIAPGQPIAEVIAQGMGHYPPPAELVETTRQTVDDLRRYVIEHEIVSVPYDENCIVAETPSFLRTAFAMMSPPGPFEQVAREAFFYVTPPEPDWEPQRVAEWMSQFSYHTLRGIAVHEAWPGHYLHFLHIRNAPSQVTKAFGAYSSFEAWAHYCEQMMLEVGWRADDPWAKLGQLGEALVRDVRFVCALGLHTAGMTVAQAQQRFVEDAFMQPATAMEEAVRGTFDPQYLSYTLGKLMLLKLRQDVQAREGDSFDLHRFHDNFLSYGAPPVPLVRAMMLGRDDGEVL